MKFYMILIILLMYGCNTNTLSQCDQFTIYRYGNMGFQISCESIQSNGYPEFSEHVNYSNSIHVYIRDYNKYEDCLSYDNYTEEICDYYFSRTHICYNESLLNNVNIYDNYGNYLYDCYLTGRYLNCEKYRYEYHYNCNNP